MDEPENVQSVEVEENEPQGAEEVIEENETQGAEEAVELNEENDNQIEESVIVSNEITGTVVNNVRSEDMEHAASSGGNNVGSSKSEINGDAEMRDEDALSEFSDIGSQVIEDMYSLEEINDFLDTTFGKVVEVEHFFPDVKKCIMSVLWLQKTVSYEVLDKKKRFRLKKMITKVRRRKVNVSKKIK